MQLDRETGRKGEFVRQQSAFRDTGVEPVAGRYHLYGSLACPWAHRTIIVRELKGLQDVVGLTIVDPIRDEDGWRFTTQEPDPLHGWSLLSEAYTATDPGWDGRVTVPVLWDAEAGRILNNESADIVVLLNEAFGELARHPELDLYPAALRPEIDAFNARIYERLNNGVYRAGFATRQAAYEDAARGVFAELDALEAHLATHRYLVGGAPTLADWRLFTTLVRFDAVYHGHFKCNVRKLSEYAHLPGYLRDLYQQPGVAATVDFDQIKRHYYMTHPSVNPTRIVPIGPAQDLFAPHGREALGP
jgi:glutathionyl-hydroquinone reductase